MDTNIFESRQSKLSNGKMHIIRETKKISIRVCKAEWPWIVKMDL